MTTVPQTHIYINIYTVPHTYIYKYLLMSKFYGEVAAYLALFYRLLLSGVECGVELRCHVVTTPPVGLER